MKGFPVVSPSSALVDRVVAAFRHALEGRDDGRTLQVRFRDLHALGGPRPNLFALVLNAHRAVVEERLGRRVRYHVGEGVAYVGGRSE